MNLIEFKQKKYWSDFIPSFKQLEREHKENSDNIKKYYTLRNKKHKTLNDETRLMLLKSRIIF